MRVQVDVVAALIQKGEYAQRDLQSESVRPGREVLHVVLFVWCRLSLAQKQRTLLRRETFLAGDDYPLDV